MEGIQKWLKISAYANFLQPLVIMSTYPLFGFLLGQFPTITVFLLLLADLAINIITFYHVANASHHKNRIPIFITLFAINSLATRISFVQSDISFLQETYFLTLGMGSLFFGMALLTAASGQTTGRNLKIVATIHLITAPIWIWLVLETPMSETQATIRIIAVIVPLLIAKILFIPLFSGYVFLK